MLRRKTRIVEIPNYVLSAISAAKGWGNTTPKPDMAPLNHILYGQCAHKTITKKKRDQ